jgi:hypothetical protein
MVSSIRRILALFLLSTILLMTGWQGSRAEPPRVHTREQFLPQQKSAHGAPQVSVLHDSADGIVLDVMTADYELTTAHLNGRAYDELVVPGAEETQLPGA